jgi:hypothetical protein
LLQSGQGREYINHYLIRGFTIMNVHQWDNNSNKKKPVTRQSAYCVPGTKLRVLYILTCFLNNPGIWVPFLIPLYIWRNGNTMRLINLPQKETDDLIFVIFHIIPGHSSSNFSILCISHFQYNQNRLTKKYSKYRHFITQERYSYDQISYKFWEPLEWLF